MTNPTFSIDALELGAMENLIYLIHDHESGRTAVVDPAWDVAKIVAIAKYKNVKITDILLTHTHHDHTNGVAGILEKYDAQIHLLKAEADFCQHFLNISQLHHGGDTIQLGKTPITLWHTPGHTPGSVCYYIDGHLLTGDTLFVFGCGRCDLHGGDSEQMHQTLKKLATDMPPQTIIHPGHNYGATITSTIAEQIAGNPFMHFDDSPKFTHYRTHIHDLERHSPYTAIKKTT